MRRVDRRIRTLIERLGLGPHPEGGYYRENYKSDTLIISPYVKKPRSAITDIYYLLTKGEVSRFHRVRHDEIWHFYEGGPVVLHVMNESLERHETHTIGEDCRYKAVVPNGCWQAAYTLGEYTLAGCNVSPGFDFEDFELLKQYPGSVEKFLALYSDLSRLL